MDPAVAVRLEKLLGTAPLRPVLSAAGATLAVNCGGVDNFLGMISTAIVEATLMDTWERLKVCRSDACRWAFYDRSKNGRSCWCSMRVCGSREKARNYRARQRAANGVVRAWWCVAHLMIRSRVGCPYSCEMRPLRYSINVTLDGCCDHRAILADEDVHRHAAENLNAG